LQDHKRFEGRITAVGEEGFVIQEDASRPAHTVRYDELKQCVIVPPPADPLAPTRSFVQAALRDHRHRVRVVLQNRKRLKGRILSASVDEFSIQEAANKPVLTVRYAEVSRVDTLPTAGERAGEVAGVLLLIPLLPLFLLAGWDGC
jgi:ribosome maturation factor RimP